MEALSAQNLEWLRALPQGPLETTALRPDEAHVSLAHGSPLHEDQYVQNMRDAWAPLRQMATAITFVGHTHIQGGFAQKDHDWHELRPRFHGGKDAEMSTLTIEPGMRYLINPGSVGQPRDFDWRAAFVVYDSAAHEVVFHRVPYDVAAAQERVLKAGLPRRLAARLKEGR
jgi:diadenosine tetraphosphatase ApaH/serine/threonine PP2A family protein phosphatase